jgi:hypothetical protein
MKTHRLVHTVLFAFLLLLAACTQAPAPQTPEAATLTAQSLNVQTVDGTALQGQYTSLALNSSGNPVISYYDVGDQDLKLVRCGNATCSSGNTIQIVESVGNTGKYTALALDSTGNPIIAYQDSNSDLKLVRCGNTTCSAGNTFQTLDGTGTTGSDTSMVLDGSGNPVISYHDGTNGDLKLVRCGNASCSAGNTFQTLDSAGTVGWYTSLVLNSSGNPVISYYDFTNGDLKVVRCGNATCSSGNTVQIVDSAGDTGRYTSLKLDSSGNPVISYFDVTNADLKLVRCGNASCSSGNVFQVVSSTGSVGQHNSLRLSSSGNPIISYYDGTGRDLELVNCGNATCSAGNTFQTVDSTGDVGQYASLVLDSSGKPVISYFDGSNYDLKLARQVVTDTTPPTATPSITDIPGNPLSANALGWYRKQVKVTWNWSDNAGGAGIDTTNCTVSTNSAGQGQLTLTATCKDLLGNQGNASQTLKVDTVVPTISYGGSSPAAPNANGWYKTNVTVSFSGTDATSGIASCPSKTLSQGLARTTNGKCTDNAGNSKTLTSPAFNIDTTKPIVNVLMNGVVVATGQTYSLAQGVPTASCQTTDALSGVATSASISVVKVTSSGEVASSNPPVAAGNYRAKCTGALDNADNANAKTVSFKVTQ